MWLASRCGYPVVDDLLEQLTPEQFAEWVAYWYLCGENDPRYHRAELLAEVINLPIRYAGMKANKDVSKYTLAASDVLPEAFRPAAADKEPDPQQQAEMLARSLGCM